MAFPCWERFTYSQMTSWDSQLRCPSKGTEQLQLNINFIYLKTKLTSFRQANRLHCIQHICLAISWKIPHLQVLSAYSRKHMLKRKKSFSERGNSPPAWHDLMVQPDDKLALIARLPHMSRGDLAPLPLPTSHAPTAFLAGLSRGWFNTPHQCKAREKKRLSAKLEGELDHPRIRHIPELVQRRGGSHSQKQRREEQDCSFQWQWPVWPPQLSCLSAWGTQRQV